MNAYRVSLWQRLRGNFAFLPTVALAAGVVAGFLMLWLDSLLIDLIKWPDALLATPEIARSALTAIATSSLTIAALAVSLTLAVLTHAGAQYSPRVLKTFLGDGVSQASIGLLLAVHAYSLVVMRGVGSGADVPHVAVGLGVVSGFVSVALLIYYLHHLATSLRASQVVATIASETNALLDQVASEARRDEPGDDWPSMRGPLPRPVSALRSGYLQSVDVTELDAMAKKANAFLHIELPLGGFIRKSECLATVWPPEAAESLEASVQSCAVIGDHPECEQDPSCGMSQLVDLALRALSPSLNDPHTAGLAVDRLGELLSHALAIEQSRDPHADNRGRHGRVRVKRRSAGDLIALCMDPIRQNAGGQCLVFERMADALDRVLAHTRGEAELDRAVLRQIRALRRAVEAQVRDPEDTAGLLDRLRALRARLRRAPDEDNLQAPILAVAGDAA
jgi:uncharacterized membrane protein